MLSLLTLLGLQTGLVDPSVTYSQLELHTRRGHLDRWTVGQGVCAPGGCPCPAQPARCVQCGLEEACLNGKNYSL